MVAAVNAITDDLFSLAGVCGQGNLINWHVKRLPDIKV